MPVAGPQLGEAVVEMLASKQVRFRPLHTLASVDPNGRVMRFQQGNTEKYDLLVAIPPHRAPALVREAGLTNAAGWVPVKPQTLATEHDGVFAVGDVTAIPIPGRWKPEVPLMLPKAGVFAHAQAEVVAARISAEIEGRRPDATFCGDGYCMLEAGGDLAGFAYGNFFAKPSPQINLRQIGMASRKSTVRTLVAVGARLATERVRRHVEDGRPAIWHSHYRLINRFMKESPMQYLIILNDPPYGTERSYNGLRLATSLAKSENTGVSVFLIGDAASCAVNGQTTPNGYYNIERMLKLLAAKGGPGCGPRKYVAQCITRPRVSLRG